VDLGDRMTCGQIQRLLPLFGGDGRDGDELPRDTGASVRRHLRGCHACQRQLAGYRAATVALRAVATATPVGGQVIGEEFFAALHASTVAQVAAPPMALPWPGVRRGLQRVAVAAALIAAGMVAAWVFLGEDGGVGTGLLRQPGLAMSGAASRDAAAVPSDTAGGRAVSWGTGSKGAVATDVIVPVSFSPAAQGLLGLRRLDLDPRWTDRPRRPEAPQPR
jgi:hypothetical protein